MITSRQLCFLAVLTAVVFCGLVLCGCGSSPGRPTASSEVVAPDDVLDFPVLFSQNCAGCHGIAGKGSVAIALANPEYLALADDATVQQVVSHGRPGTPMPAFAKTAGGMLTDKQIDAITSGIRSHWSKPGVFDGTNPPPYAAKSTGDGQRGEVAYKTYCASCHGAAGRGGPKGSNITNDSFLALVSDQGLRTIVITGRPELGAPDWRGNTPGKPMSDQEITDVIAWLAAHRVQNPGQPYSASKAQQ